MARIGRRDSGAGSQWLPGRSSFDGDDSYATPPRNDPQDHPVRRHSIDTPPPRRSPNFRSGSMSEQETSQLDVSVPLSDLAGYTQVASPTNTDDISGEEGYVRGSANRKLAAAPVVAEHILERIAQATLHA